MPARILLLGAALAFGAPASAQTLFADFGGLPGLAGVVDAATTLWTADPRIASTFEDTNIDRFKRLLVEQLCQLSGGDCIYRGRSMSAAHRGLHLSTQQFNALVEGLQLAMDQQGKSFALQNRLLAILAPMHRDVVAR